MTEFNYTAQMICACLEGEHDALVKLKAQEAGKEGEAAALRANLLNLAIENLRDLVIRPLEEVIYR